MVQERTELLKESILASKNTSVYYSAIDFDQFIAFFNLLKIRGAIKGWDKLRASEGWRKQQGPTGHVYITPNWDNRPLANKVEVSTFKFFIRGLHF